MRRWRIGGAFLAVFGLIEVILVLSIDGAFYPFQWFDIISAVIILWLNVADLPPVAVRPVEWRQRRVNFPA